MEILLPLNLGANMKHFSEAADLDDPKKGLLNYEPMRKKSTLRFNTKEVNAGGDEWQPYFIRFRTWYTCRGCNSLAKTPKKFGG